MGTSVACSGETKWFWRVANCKSWFKEGSGCGCFTCCCFICIAHSTFLQTMKIKSLWVDSVRQFPIKWPCNANLNFVVTAEHPQNGELLEDPDTIGTTGNRLNFSIHIYSHKSQFRMQLNSFVFLCVCVSCFHRYSMRKFAQLFLALSMVSSFAMCELQPCKLILPDHCKARTNRCDIPSKLSFYGSCHCFFISCIVRQTCQSVQTKSHQTFLSRL